MLDKITKNDNFKKITDPGNYKKLSLLSEFKDFAMKGNVIDMAVGIVIGAAFGKIVTSLVANIITPLVSLLTGKVNFSNLKWIIRPLKLAADGKTVADPGVIVDFGIFIQNIVDFILVAFSIFMVIKILNSAKRKKAIEEVPEPEAPPAPSNEALLLAEIRDLLKSSK